MDFFRNIRDIHWDTWIMGMCSYNPIGLHCELSEQGIIHPKKGPLEGSKQRFLRNAQHAAGDFPARQRRFSDKRLSRFFSELVDRC